MAAASLATSCTTPDRLDEPWPPDPATCLQHRHPDARRNSAVRLATQGTYSRQTAHTAVVYFCFQRVDSARPAAHLITQIAGCVTQVTPPVIDVPGGAMQYEAVPFTISICDRGHGSFAVGLSYAGQQPGEIIDTAGVNVTADDHGVLIEELRAN